MRFIEFKSLVGFMMLMSTQASIACTADKKTPYVSVNDRYHIILNFGLAKGDASYRVTFDPNCDGVIDAHDVVLARDSRVLDKQKSFERAEKNYATSIVGLDNLQAIGQPDQILAKERERLLHKATIRKQEHLEILTNIRRWYDYMTIVRKNALKTGEYCVIEKTDYSTRTICQTDQYDEPTSKGAYLSLKEEANGFHLGEKYFAPDFYVRSVSYDGLRDFPKDLKALLK